MKINYKGLKKDEYINLLIECNMCTQKWTKCKLKKFDIRRKEIIKNRLGK